MKRAIFCGLSALTLFSSIPALALPPVPPSQVVAGVDTATNLAHPMRTDSSGNVYIVGSGASGAVFGPSAIGIAPSQPPVFMGGIDGGGLTRGMLTDTSGRQLMVGAGVAGTPAGGVVSMQGVSGGTNLPVSQASASALNATVVQSTASNLNATVVNAAGSAIMGKVGIDQTTPGTTNGVQTLTGSTTAVTQVTAANLNAQVQGAGADHSAVVGNPVLVAGYDGTNTHILLTDTNGVQFVNTEGKKASYAATAYSITASSGTPVVQLQGSATKTIRVTKIVVTAQATTGAGNSAVYLAKATATATGASTSPSIVSMDSTNAAATAAPLQFASGTLVGATAFEASTLAQVSSAITAPPYVWTPAPNTQEIVLRGTSQFLVVQLSIASTTGAQANVAIYWTEE